MEKIVDPERSWFFDFYEEWSQVFGVRAWYTITPVNISFEWDKCMGGVEFTIILVGIGLRWRWTYTETDMAREIKQQIAKFED